MFTYRPVPKKVNHKRGGFTQKQMGDISEKVTKELYKRSGGLCEVRIKCIGAVAVARAHTIGRRIIPNKTTVDDLFHSCVACHVHLDETPEGIRFKRMVRRMGGTGAYLKLTSPPAP